LGNKYTEDDIKRANIEYHTKLAENYDKEQPYFSLENTSRVDDVLRRLSEEYGNDTLLDIGCGTGFILSIAKKYFKKVIGIDITQAMLDKVDTTGNVELRIADSSHMPFGNRSIDVCTAYSVLHHLPSLMPTYREIFRCLKVGGAFYADGDPNYYCWRELRKLKTNRTSRLLRREIDSICNIPKEFKEEHGLTDETIKMAEYHRYMRCGMKQESVMQSLKKSEFSLIEFKYQWFLGEGDIYHNISPEVAKTTSEHLRELMPLSRSLFKYISFIASKEWEIK